jgi:hypothetical protein
MSPVTSTVLLTGVTIGSSVLLFLQAAIKVNAKIENRKIDFFMIF